MRDVYLFDTPDGGEVTKDLELRDGLESAVYLSLFGGNLKDSGLEKCPNNWWGNRIETDPNKMYRSETAHLLATITPALKNLRRLEDAANRDLAWLKEAKYVETIRVSATMPALNHIRLTVTIDGVDVLEFNPYWGDVASGPIKTPPHPPAVTVNDGAQFSGHGKPNTWLVLVRADGTTIEVRTGPDGNWKIEPYPLEGDEVAYIYSRDDEGLESNIVWVTGDYPPLLFDGSWMYDGSQRFDGKKR